MMKKAFRNTFIFSLIIANLIIWPMLFTDLGENSRKEASVEQNETPGEVKSNEEAAVTENSVKSPNTEGKTESSSKKANSQDGTFKILQIE